jgi:hypothetical protein
MLAKTLGAEGDKRQMARTLDGAGQHTLMAGACAAIAPGSNSPLFRYVALQDIHSLVVNRLRFLGAELAHARLADEAPPAPSITAATLGATISLFSRIFAHSSRSSSGQIFMPEFS